MGHNSILRADPPKKRIQRNQFLCSKAGRMPLVKIGKSERRQMEDERHKSSIRWLRRVAFGVGHVLNDLIGGMVMTLFLIFIQHIREIPAKLTGWIFFTGQVVDAVGTLVVGYSVDRWRLIPCYSQKKGWNAMGAILAVVGTFFQMKSPIGCDLPEDCSTTYQVIYYAACGMIIQIGFASGQISHLSLINAVSRDDEERIVLNAIRYGFTVTSYMTVYIIGTIFMGIQRKAEGPTADSIFKIMVTSLSIGVGASLFFHIFIHEPPSPIVVRGTRRDWKACLKNCKLYLYTTIYAMARVITNLSLIYLPSYLMYTIKLDSIYLFTIPLIYYISSMVVSGLQRVMIRLVGIKKLNCLGLAFVGVASLLILLLKEKDIAGTIVMAIIFGIGSTTTIITALAMISNMIGDKQNNSGFVYRVVSFCDKTSTGVVVVVIQAIQSMLYQTKEESAQYTRYAMCGLNLTTISLAAVCLLLTNLKRFSPKTEEEGELSYLVDYSTSKSSLYSSSTLVSSLKR